MPRLSSPIEIHDLTKSFGRFRPTLAVEGLSFHVGDGRIVGFLGPNGAGKSTTLRALLGLIEPSSGHTLIEGRGHAGSRRHRLAAQRAIYTQKGPCRSRGSGVASFEVFGIQGRKALQAFSDAGLDVTRGRPLDGDGVMLRCLPWLTAGVLACAFLPLLNDWPSTGDLIALALAPVIVGSALLTPWERLPTWMQAIPPLLPFVMVALVRSSHVSVTATYTPVVLLPVIWFAFYGTRGQLLVSVIGLGITLAIPSPAFDGYPAIEPLAAAFWMGVAGITGFSINELVLQRERLQVQLGTMARTDALTGLPNRRAWDETLDRELALANRSGSPVCAALLDLDHFKEFNDLNGHPAGDRHLEEVAGLWRARLRTADVIARYGGEEFAVLLTSTDALQAQDVIETLRACVPSDETVSAGIAEWDGVESGAELLMRADRALYEAKRHGRNRTIAIHAPRFAPAELTAAPELA